MALEKMLNKIAAHPTLQHDGDLKIFLESEAFNMDVKHKERKEPGLGESKGMFASLSLGVGSGSKFVEQDDVSAIFGVLNYRTKIYSGSMNAEYTLTPSRIN
jgi:hypothetical protein